MFDKQISISQNKPLVFKSFKDLPAPILPGSSVFLQKDYFMSLEEADIPGLEFRYIPFLSGGRYEGLYYFQIINLSSRELGQIVHFEPYNQLLSGISMLLQNFLFGVKKDKPHYVIVSGNMCLSGEFGIYHSKNTGNTIYTEFPAILSALKQELEQTGKVIAEIVKDYPAEMDPFTTIFKTINFNLLAMDPVMKMTIRPGWKSMDDYVLDLSSKYRQRFNQAKKKIESCEIKNLTTEFLIKNKSRINELYEAVQHKAPVRIIKPDANYIIALSAHLSSKMIVKGIFKGDVLLAFLIGIADENHFEAHHIGIDYHYNKEHSLYLNILYLYIEMAISAKAGLLSFGRTALEMKTTVGAKSFPYHTYVKLNNSLLNRITKKMLPDTISENWTPRDPFRK